MYYIGHKRMKLRFIFYWDSEIACDFTLVPYVRTTKLFTCLATLFLWSYVVNVG
jgi:hypothetical protein